VRLRTLDPHHPLGHDIAREQQAAEDDDYHCGTGLEPAHRQDAVAGTRLGDALSPGPGADRDGGDCRNHDRGPDGHDEGRDDTGPEQPLRQREDQYQDRAGTRPQTDGDDRGETPLPSSRSGQLLRFRRMGVPPGRGMVVVIIMMMMLVCVRIAACVIIMMMMVMSMIVAITVVTMMTMTVVTMIVVAVRVLSVLVMRVTVIVIRRRHGGADRGRTVKRPQSRDESAPLHPQQSQPDHDDQRIAHDFDGIDRAPHSRRGRIQQRGGDAHQRHRDQGLKQRGGERQHHAARPGLFVGDHVGRDHRLAVTGAGGVENAVEEGEPEQTPSGGAIGLGGAYQAGELAIEFRLLGEDPAEHAAYRHSRRLRARRAERYALRQGGIKQACHEQKAEDGSGRQSDMKYASLPDGFHGHPHRKLVRMTIAGATLRDG